MTSWLRCIIVVFTLLVTHQEVRCNQHLFTVEECEKQSPKSDKEMYHLEVWKRDEPESKEVMKDNEEVIPDNENTKCSEVVRFTHAQCSVLLAVKQGIVAPSPKDADAKKKRDDELVNSLHELKKKLMADGVCHHAIRSVLLDKVEAWENLGMELKFGENFQTIP